MSVRTLRAVLMCGLLLAIPVAVAADPEPDLPVCLADAACASDDAVQAPEGTQAQVEPDRLSADADERLSDAASPTLTPLPASRSDDAPVPALPASRSDDAPVPAPPPMMPSRSDDAPVPTPTLTTRAGVAAVPRALLPTRTSEVPLPTPPVPTRSIRPPAVIQSSSTGPATQPSTPQGMGSPPATSPVEHLPPGPATRLP